MLSVIAVVMAATTREAAATPSSYVSGTYVLECFSYRDDFCSPLPFLYGIPESASYAYDQTYAGASAGDFFSSAALAQLTFQVTPHALTVVERAQASYLGSPTGGIVAGAVSSVVVDVADVVHFESDSLPAGTPVTFRFFSWLDSPIQQNEPCGTHGGAHAYVVVLGHPELSLNHDNCGNGSSHMEASVTLSSVVGGSFGWTAQYAAATSAFLDFGFDSSGFADTRRSLNGPLDPDLDALFFQVLTPGVTLRSDSGANYALPAPPIPGSVPEPSPIELLVLAWLAFSALHARPARR